LSFATKIVNRLIGERDWAAQEVSHLLFRIPLFSSSRQVINFDCRQEDDIGTIIDFEQEERTPGKTILQKYKERRPQFADVTLLAFLRSFEHGSRRVHQTRPNAKDRVVVYQPHYKSQPNHEDYPDYCRTKIALHHPWREYPSLPWNGCETWPAALAYCTTNCQAHDPDHLQPLDIPVPEDEFDFEAAPEEEEHDLMAQLAGQTDNRNPAARNENPDDLGGRTVDWTRYWEDHVNTYRGVGQDDMPDIHAGNHWWKRAREIAPVQGQVAMSSMQMLDSLAAEQRLIFNKVMHHHEHGGLPLLLNIDGRAGTGKSFIIKVLSAHLTVSTGRDDTIQRCAYTGAASFGIGGSTVHRLLTLPVNRPLENLRPRELKTLQNRLEHTKYIIIDEKSMISLQTL
jgi:ATP-dependent DNA helicase PIF1